MARRRSTRPRRRPIGLSALVVVGLLALVVLATFRWAFGPGDVTPGTSPQEPGATAADAGTQGGPPPGDAAASADGSSTTGDGPQDEEPPVVEETARVAATGVQEGVQLYLHDVEGGDDHTPALLDHVVGLGANSLGINFPVYTDGATPSQVYAGEETPSVQTLEAVVAAAQERGLYVTVRPLLDEANIATTPLEWRGSIRPPDPGAWFASYGDLISRYAATGADEFVLGAELNSLQVHTDEWKRLAARVREEHEGALSYAFNWNAVEPGVAPVDSYGIDFYVPIQLGDDATVDELTAAMTDVLARQVSAVDEPVVLQEVGIAALPGMYPTPWVWGEDTAPEDVDESIQATWFEAACRAHWQEGTAGIYYWFLDSNIDPSTADPAWQPAGSFLGREAQDRVRDCFTAR